MRKAVRIVHRFSTRRMGLCAGLCFAFLLFTASVSADELPPGCIKPDLPRPEQGAIRAGVQPITSGMVSPTFGTTAPGHADSLFVVDQIGRLWQVNLVSHTKRLFLDVRSLLVPLGIFGPGTYDERGFLGLAFHPNFASNGLFYTFTTEPIGHRPDFPSTAPPGKVDDHQNVIREWHTNPATLTPPQRTRVVLRVNNPQFNHTGGNLNFGADGNLFIALGDGGGEDDQNGQIGIDGKVTFGHGPRGNGQNPGNPLGKILRISVVPGGGKQYSVPADNPFIGRAGFLPEIFAFGLRNPFRFSFDMPTGRLFAGDVGQNNVEELDLIRGGRNYGWRVKEGTFIFNPEGFRLFGFATDGCVVRNSPRSPAGLTDPIAEYDHDAGRAIIAGFVYHGRLFPSLRGSFVFGDYSEDDHANGHVFHLIGGNKIVRLVDENLDLFVLGFGQDASGELYVLGNETGVPGGTTGVVKRLVPTGH
jgi:glucose/arabinose dehydrogenase